MESNVWSPNPHSLTEPIEAASDRIDQQQVARQLVGAAGRVWSGRSPTGLTKPVLDTAGGPEYRPTASGDFDGAVVRDDVQVDLEDCTDLGRHALGCPPGGDRDDERVALLVGAGRHTAQ